MSSAMPIARRPMAITSPRMATRAMLARPSECVVSCALDRIVGNVGQPGSDDEDHGAEKHVAAELDEQRDQVANLSELEPIRRLRGREQHGNDQHEQRHQTRRLHAAGEHVCKSESLGKRVEPDGCQQAREQPGGKPGRRNR